jgi:coniferyl-aldehyde dehydrogenase
MKAASENLVPVTLELGGKSPVIVDPAYPLRQLAESIAYGKLGNGGQACVAPDYAMVHEDHLDAFVEAFDQAVRGLYPGGPTAGDYTSVVNERHHQRLLNLLDDARSKGATVRAAGADAASAQGRAHTLAPTLVLGAADHMLVMQEEIFGPVLPVITYGTLDEAIAYVNGHPRPLALYYFGSDRSNQRKVLSLTTSGNVTINGTLMHYVQEDLPFGGVGPSGMGAYHGIEGFKALSHAKGVFRTWRWNASQLTRPPFGTLTNWVLKAMLR